MIYSYTFDLHVGHRVIGDSRCCAPHGHSYKLTAAYVADTEQAAARAFRRCAAFLETIAGGFVLQEGDPLIDFLRGEDSRCTVIEAPPTMEFLVEVFAESFRGMNDLMAQVAHVSLEEPGGLKVTKS